jgi:hypothetical protein
MKHLYVNKTEFQLDISVKAKVSNKNMYSNQPLFATEHQIWDENIQKCNEIAEHSSIAQGDTPVDVLKNWIQFQIQYIE